MLDQGWVYLECCYCYVLLFIYSLYLLQSLSIVHIHVVSPIIIWFEVHSIVKIKWAFHWCYFFICLIIFNTLSAKISGIIVLILICIFSLFLLDIDRFQIFFIFLVITQSIPTTPQIFPSLPRILALQLQWQIKQSRWQIVLNAHIPNMLINNRWLMWCKLIIYFMWVF